MKHLPCLPFGADNLPDLRTFLVGTRIQHQFGYAIGIPKERYDSILLYILFPYGNRIKTFDSIQHGVQLKYVHMIDKKPFTKFTCNKPQKVDITPLHEDFLFYKDINLIFKVLSTLSNHYELVFIHRSLEGAYWRYLSTLKDTTFNLTLWRGEDVYPNDVTKDNSIVAMIHNKDGPLFSATYTNDREMFYCDGESAGPSVDSPSAFKHIITKAYHLIPNNDKGDAPKKEKSTINITGYAVGGFYVEPW